MNEFVYRGIKMPSDFFTDEIQAWKIGVDQAMDQALVVERHRFYALEDDGRVVDVYRTDSNGYAQYWNYFDPGWRSAGHIDNVLGFKGSAVEPCTYDVVEQYIDDHRDQAR
jgi:hypothetical protein